MTNKLPEARSLAFFICDSLKVEYGSLVFKDIYAYTLLYICAGTNIKVYHRQLSDLVNFKELEFTPAQFRMSLSDSGYVIADLKFYCTFISLLRTVDKFEAEELFYRYGICRCDAVWTYKCVTQSNILRKEIRKRIKSQNVNAKKFSPEELGVLKENFAALLPQIQRHIRQVTTKKLTFIRKHFNMTYDEFWSDLMVHSLRAYYKSVPNDFSELKQLNYIRSTISNRALNIIESYVSQKRQRLVNVGTDNKDGAKFVLMTTAESQLPVNSEGESQSLESMGEADFWTNASEITDFKLSVESMLEKYVNTKRGAILMIFSGYEFPRFSEWLRGKRILRSQDKNSQDIIAARTLGESFEIVAEFLQVPETSIKKALGEFANELGIVGQ